MTRHLLRDLENLKKEILGVGALVAMFSHETPLRRVALAGVAALAAPRAPA